jgi:sensor c-di-GMP phosphodiesterase-like protein
VDLVLHDEIVALVKKHSIDRQLNFSSNNLKSRAALIKRLENAFNTFSLQPKTIDLELTNDSCATVSVFDWKAQIMSLLSDPYIMRFENIGRVRCLHRSSDRRINHIW